MEPFTYLAPSHPADLRTAIAASRKALTFVTPLFSDLGYNKCKIYCVLSIASPPTRLEAPESKDYLFGPPFCPTALTEQVPLNKCE